MALYLFRVYCIDCAAWKEISSDVIPPSPLECPTNPAHSLNADSLSSMNTDGFLLKLDQTTPQTIINGTPNIPSINGGAGANDDLTLQGTAHATKDTSYVSIQPTGGNVGIGTTVPAKVLDVTSASSPAIRVFGSTGTPQIAIENTGGAGGSASMYFMGGSASGQGYFGYRNGFNIGTTSSVGGAIAAKLSMDSTGNVGIGTTAPLHYLDVSKTAENQRTVYGLNVSTTAATLQSDAASTGSDETLDERYHAWKFTASAAHTVGSWAVRIKKVGTVTNTTDYVRIKIYSDSAGVPNALLATTDVVRMGSLTTAYVSYLFGADLTLVNGTAYWMAVERSAAVTGGGSIAVDRNGTALTYTDVAAPVSADWIVNAGLGRYILYGQSPRAGSFTSTNQVGVQGTSTNYIGVYASSTNNSGVYGNSTNGIGVYGYSANSIGVQGTSTNLFGVYGYSTNNYGGVFYQSGTLTVANATNTVLIRRMSVTNSVGSLNCTGNVLQITDNPTGTGTVSGSLINGSIDGTVRLDFNPRVIDGAAATAHMLDTKNTLTNATAKLLELRNGGTAKLTIQKDGNLLSGTATAGLTLKQGANGKCGTFVVTGATPVAVANTSIAITDTVCISLNTVGGTISQQPYLLTITAGVGFTVAAGAADTSTYNYAIISNAA